MRALLAFVALMAAATMVMASFTLNSLVLAAVGPIFLAAIVFAVLIPGMLLGWLYYAGRAGGRPRSEPRLISIIVFAGSAFMGLQLAATHYHWLPPDSLRHSADVVALYVYTVLMVAFDTVLGINRWQERRKKARNGSGNPNNR